MPTTYDCKGKIEPKQVGAVVVFPAGMTEQQVRNALLQFGGTLPPHHRIESIQTQTFNPDWGSPVFYVP